MQSTCNVDRSKVYKFVHRHDEYIATDLRFKAPYRSESGLVEVTRDGVISVCGSALDGYAWDGCTPKFQFLDFVMGTPDGRFDLDTCEPITYYASMFHDALYQFKDEVPISRKTSDLIFFKLLNEADFTWSQVYYGAVRTFGGFLGKWHQRRSAGKFTILNASWWD